MDLYENDSSDEDSNNSNDLDNDNIEKLIDTSLQQD